MSGQLPAVAQVRVEKGFEFRGLGTGFRLITRERERGASKGWYLVWL